MSYHLTNILDFSPIFIQKIHISLLHSLLIFFKSKQNSFFGQNIELNFLEHNTKPLIFNWDALFISMFIHISFWNSKEEHKGINLKLLLHKIHNVMVHKYGTMGILDLELVPSFHLYYLCTLDCVFKVTLFSIQPTGFPTSKWIL